MKNGSQNNDLITSSTVKSDHKRLISVIYKQCQRFQIEFISNIRIRVFRIDQNKLILVELQNQHTIFD